MLKGGKAVSKLPKFVHIKEVGPRDGLQNEKMFLPTSEKIEWINMLSDSGLEMIEFTSFVHPKWIPALADASEVGKGIKRNADVSYSALIPNLIGLEHALEAGIDEVSVFISASETHNRKNVNKSKEQTYPLLNDIIKEAKNAGKKVTGYISTVFDCPFEGKIEPEQVIRESEKLLAYGVDTITLGDTIGSAIPTQVEQLLDRMLSRYPADKIFMHFHDTKGMAAANILKSLDYGINHFDSSIGGLGGCPYAPGAKGNVATNDLVYLLHGMGIETGVSEEKIFEASSYLQSKMNKDLPSSLSMIRVRINIETKTEKGSPIIKQLESPLDLPHRWRMLSSSV